MKRIFSLFLGAVLVLGLAFSVLAASSPGSKDDPFITLSYLENTFYPSLLSQTGTRADTRFQTAYNTAQNRFEGQKAAYTLLAENAALVSRVMQRFGASADASVRDMTLKKGDILTGGMGVMLVVKSGALQQQSGSIINLTAGADVLSGGTLGIRNQFFFADSAVKVTATSDAVVTVSGTVSKAAGYAPQYTHVANALKYMNLFQGTKTGYNLEWKATRLQGLVMMIRLLGQEADALSYTGTHPFADVPEWGDRYVAYAYQTGLTTGTSAQKFTPDAEITSVQYMTFILRAMGYSDKNGDFVWSAPWALAESAGILSESETQMLTQTAFYRDQMVYLSYKALYGRMKGSAETLAQRLIEARVFTTAQFVKARELAGI